MRKLSLVAAFWIICTQTSSSQTASAITDQQKYKAGSMVYITVTNIHPVPQENVRLIADYFNVKSGAPNRRGIECIADIPANATSAKLSCNTSLEDPGSTYTCERFFAIRLGTSKGEDIEAILPPFEVVQSLDATIFPKTAIATLSPTEAQVLQDASYRTESLLDQLTTHLDGASNETSDLLRYLIQTAVSGKALLNVTAVRYQQAADGKHLPILFDDFNIRYDALLVELRSPNRRKASAELTNEPHLVMAQFRDQVTVTPSPNLSGTLGPYASKLEAILADQASVFEIVAETDSDKLILNLHSSPAGAKVSWKRNGEDKPIDGPSPTDIDNYPIDYADWTFRFLWGRCEVDVSPDLFNKKAETVSARQSDCQVK
jgi:hypothetical protein